MSEDKYDRESGPFEEGRKAHDEGYSPLCNPYAEDGMKFMMWDDGWSFAQDEEFELKHPPA